MPYGPGLALSIFGVPLSPAFPSQIALLNIHRFTQVKWLLNEQEEHPGNRRLLFHAFDSKQRPVCIKLTTKYATNVHAALDRAGLSPKLFGAEQIAGGSDSLHAVVSLFFTTGWRTLTVLTSLLPVMKFWCISTGCPCQHALAGTGACRYWCTSTMVENLFALELLHQGQSRS